MLLLLTTFGILCDLTGELVGRDQNLLKRGLSQSFVSGDDCLRARPQDLDLAVRENLSQSRLLLAFDAAQLCARKKGIEAGQFRVRRPKRRHRHFQLAYSNKGSLRTAHDLEAPSDLRIR